MMMTAKIILLLPLCWSAEWTVMKPIHFFCFSGNRENQVLGLATSESKNCLWKNGRCIVLRDICQRSWIFICFSASVIMSFSDLYAKYNCTYCQEEINGIRVRCAECIDFDICLQVKCHSMPFLFTVLAQNLNFSGIFMVNCYFQCFSLGAEIGSHKNDHSYQYMVSKWGFWIWFIFNFEELLTSLSNVTFRTPVHLGYFWDVVIGLQTKKWGCWMQ